MPETVCLPETPEEISTDWLSEVLGQQVDTFSMQALGDGQGFMGDVLLIRTQGQHPLALVAKLPKKSNRVMGELLGVYEREIMFFRSFADTLPIRAPQLYFSEFDRDKGSENQAEILRTLDKAPAFLAGIMNVAGRWIAGAKKRRYMLLIEFLDDMQPGDQLVGLDEAACHQVVRSIAPMHAQYWNSDDLNGHFWLLDLDIDARLRHGIFLKQVDAFRQVLGPELDGHLDWLVHHGETLARRFFAEAPTTLLHCDLRLDNVIFNGDDCAFIDFQLVRKGPGAYDVAYFMTSAVKKDATPAQRQNILRSYHQALDKPDYTFAALERDYQRALMMILASLSGAAQVELGNDRGQNMMAAWMRRLKACVLEVDPATLL